MARFQEALAIREALAAAAPDNRELRNKVSVSLSYLGYALSAIGRLTSDSANDKAALANFERGCEISIAFAAADPTNTQAQRSAAAALSNVAQVKTLARRCGWRTR